MGAKTSKLDKAFIQRQSQRLLKLREDLLRTTRTEATEQTELNSQSIGEAQEYEDDAQKLALLELEGTLAERTAQRLTRVERALQKIADGTYGLSDASGEPIPVERLEAVPEAIYTLKELRAREPADTHRASGKRRT
jgi:DnaK suppressor protein